MTSNQEIMAEEKASSLSIYLDFYTGHASTKTYSLNKIQIYG